MKTYCHRIIMLSYNFILLKLDFLRAIIYNFKENDGKWSVNGD